VIDKSLNSILFVTHH